MSSKVDEATLFGNKKVTEDVKRKVLAEKRAHDTVKALLEENVTRRFFTDAIDFLTGEHYNDVIEERAILHLCGYAVCDNKLKNVLSQQYRISGNKVYDITNRKNFCSNACYKASEHVRKQIATTPLWLRGFENIPSVELDSSGSGLKGDAVDLLHFAANEDDHCMGTSDESDTTDEDPEDHACESSALPEDDPHFSQHDSSRTPHGPDQEVTPKPASTRQESSFRTSPIVEGVKTNEESRIKEARKLNKQRLLEGKLNQIVLGDKAPVLPEEAKNAETEAVHIYTRQVEQFYGGQLTCREVQFEGPEQKQEAHKVETPVYPHVDSKNQTVIRRKILHEKLAKTFQELMPKLPLDVSSHDLKQLISSFRLSSSNIVLATAQYPLMAIMLLILLSKRNPDVTSCLRQSEALVNHITSFYQLSLTSLTKKIEDLLNSSAPDR